MEMLGVNDFIKVTTFLISNGVTNYRYDGQRVKFNFKQVFADTVFNGLKKYFA